MSINFFDAICYINLKHRKDREKHLLSELKKAGANPNKTFRIDAVFNPLNGHLGCALSHIKALTLAQKKGLKNLLILEDDCHFLTNKKGIDVYTSYFLNKEFNWDVFFLGTRVILYKKTDDPQILQILTSTHSHAYAVNAHYFSTLTDCFEKAAASLEKILFYFQVRYETIDFKWNFLQIKDRWYMLKNMIAGQRSSFSDIVQQTVRYSLKKSKQGLDAGKLFQSDLF